MGLASTKMMKLILSLVLIAAAKAQFDDIVVEVNSNPNSTWTAAAPADRFGSLEDVATVCGTYLKGHANYTDHNWPVMEESEGFTATEELVDGFDTRTAFPKCPVIAKVRDQSACGSCWAFGSTETFEGRRCVAKGENVEFSTDDTAGCCNILSFQCGLSMGCGGGQPDSALGWMSKTGVVTGGDYGDIGSGSSCKPYEFEACAHHVPATSKYPACPSSEYSIKCHKSCSESKYTKSYSDDKVNGGSVKRINSVAGMVTALQKGPLSVAITVYSDFPTYKSGVYKHTTGSALGGHAVSIIGYGTDATAGDYWIVKNSWNDQWGDGGTIKMAKGTNECGIEGDATAIDF